MSYGRGLHPFVFKAFGRFCSGLCRNFIGLPVSAPPEFFLFWVKTWVVDEIEPWGQNQNLIRYKQRKEAAHKGHILLFC